MCIGERLRTKHTERKFISDAGDKCSAAEGVWAIKTPKPVVMYTVDVNPGTIQTLNGSIMNMY